MALYNCNYLVERKGEKQLKQTQTDHTKTSQKKTSETKLELAAAPTYAEEIARESYTISTACQVCYPIVEIGPNNRTRGTKMGNRSSSSTTCTCKLEQPHQHGKSSRGSRKCRKASERDAQLSPIQDESLSDVFHKLQISPNKSIGQTEIARHVLYYAWFFDHSVSVSLKTIAHHYLTECLRVNQFNRFIQSLLNNHGIQDPLHLYKKPGKRKPDDKLEYHITVKFCDRKQCLPYQENVHHFIGKSFNLHIVGLFFTEKTFGYRVKLTAAQKTLFDERTLPTKQVVNESLSHTTEFNCEQIAKMNEVEVNQDSKKVKDPKCKSDLHTSYPGIVLVRQKEDFHPTDSRAHITIGCVPFVKAMQTGEDLVDIVDLETRPKMFHSDFEIQGATLRQFGKNATAFVIYPQHEIIAEAIFNVFI